MMITEQTLKTLAQDLAGQWPKYAYSVHSMLESFYWHISFDGLDYDWYIIGPNKLEERGKEPTMQAAALALANIIIEHADDEEEE